MATATRSALHTEIIAAMVDEAGAVLARPSR